MPVPGCQCIACWSGEPHTPPDERAIERALAPPLWLVQTSGSTTSLAAPTCEGDPMLCRCPQHQAEKTALIRRGPQGAGNANPFSSRAA